MLLRIHRSPFTQGTVLFVTLITALVIGIVLVAYLVLVSQNQEAVVRSERWNSALAVAEAGVEEALAHIQKNCPTNMLMAGWAVQGTNWSVNRQFEADNYTVAISMATNPVIYSTGTSLLPWNQASVARMVRVQTVLTTAVYNAIATKENIKLNGFTITTDSYDSGDPDHSTHGRYDPRKRKDHGDIRTNLGTQDGLNSGNAKIYGKVATGPNGSVDLGPGSVVGDFEWHSGDNTGIKPGYFADDSNVPMPPVEPPFTGGAWVPSAGAVDGVNYSTVLNTGNYQMANLGGKIIVTGDAVLLVTSRVQITGQDCIVIMPGASLQLYVAAPTATIGGMGVINKSGIATNFSYYGLPSNTSLALGGSGTLAGFIYAPNADVTLGGGAHVYGAIMSKTLNMNGNSWFSFDEALARTTTIRYYAIVSWDEI